MASRNKGGRKSKLEITPKIRRAIVEQIESGVPIKYACDAVGIDESTYRRWVEKGASPKAAKHYRTFRADVTRARAVKVHRLLAHIEKCGQIPNVATAQIDWKAAAWILEHTEREQFHKREEIKSEVVIDADPRVELDRLVSRLAARAGAAKAASKPEPEGG